MSSDVSMASAGCVIRKRMLFQTTQTLPGKGHVSKPSAWTRRRLARGVTESHFEGATEFSEWEWSESAPVTHIKSPATHNSLYWRVAQNKPLIKKSHLELPKTIMVTQLQWRRCFCCQMRLALCWKWNNSMLTAYCDVHSEC